MLGIGAHLGHRHLVRAPTALDGETVDSIVEKAAEDFSVDPETIRTDLAAFAESLRAADVLE